MALSDKILNDFFNKTKKKELTSNIQEIASESSLPPRYRVFDEPDKENNSTIETPDKLQTNLRQNWDKVETNLGQIEDKPKTNARPKIDDAPETSDKLKTQPETKPKTNLGQTKDKLQVPYPFSSLIGLQRKITLFIHDTCQFCRSNVTNPLSIEHIANSCETTKSSAQKTIQRLENKNILIRNKFKNGRGGWTQYELSEAIFQEIVQEETQFKLRTNLRQSWDKVKSEPKTELETGTLSSSSNNINNLTTTTSAGFLKDLDKQQLPEDWDKIDFSSLLEAFKVTKKTQFFGKAQLRIIYDAAKDCLTSSDVQNSINMFAYGLTHYHEEEPYSGMVNPGAVLLDSLKKGGTWFEHRYLSQEELPAYKVYLNVLKKINLQECFIRWLSKDRDEKYKQYRQKLNSSHYYDNRVFEEMALEDYMKNLWPNERKLIIAEVLLGVADKSQINKFEIIEASGVRLFD